MLAWLKELGVVQPAESPIGDPENEGAQADRPTTREGEWDRAQLILHFLAKGQTFEVAQTSVAEIPLDNHSKRCIDQRMAFYASLDLAEQQQIFSGRNNERRVKRLQARYKQPFLVRGDAHVPNWERFDLDTQRTGSFSD